MQKVLPAFSPGHRVHAACMHICKHILTVDPTRLPVCIICFVSRWAFGVPAGKDGATLDLPMAETPSSSVPIGHAFKQRSNSANLNLSFGCCCALHLHLHFGRTAFADCYDCIDQCILVGGKSNFCPVCNILLGPNPWEHHKLKYDFMLDSLVRKVSKPWHRDGPHSRTSKTGARVHYILCRSFVLQWGLFWGSASFWRVTGSGCITRACPLHQTSRARGSAGTACACIMGNIHCSLSSQ